MNKNDLQQPVTKEDLELAIVQICQVIIKSQVNFATKDDLKNFATKDDLKNFATKDDLKAVHKDIIDIKADVSDIKRRVIDLEMDTPTKKEFTDLKIEVAALHN